MKTERSNSRAGYIVSPGYDWLFFLFPPTLALVIGIAISGTSFADSEIEFWGQDATLAGVMIGVIIHAHIVVVFFRSHGNAGIFKTHPFRFVAVPIILFGAMLASEWILISIAVLCTFWDVYHSGAQTFGFGRIYDARVGNDLSAGRRLGYWLNQLLYAGPILAGATMMAHFENFEKFEDLGATFFTSIPAFMEGNQRYAAWAVVAGGAAFLSYYLYANWRLARTGYEVSPIKVFLYITTGACSIYTWGFNTWGEAFLIMNLFHAVQYFGLVWSSEKGQMMRLFRLENLSFGKQICSVLFVGLALLYGYFVEALDTDWRSLWAITLLVSILHFWYDGFVWSVRRKQV